MAAVALTAILLLNVATGLITDVRQHTIETRYYPAVHAARDLQGELRAVQRALQDAVSTGDSAGAGERRFPATCLHAHRS